MSNNKKRAHMLINKIRLKKSRWFNELLIFKKCFDRMNSFEGKSSAPIYIDCLINTYKIADDLHIERQDCIVVSPPREELKLRRPFLLTPFATGNFAPPPRGQ